MWILLDKKNICRCMASLPQNLHKDKLASMDMYELEDGPYLVGDEYSPNTGKWTPHPENYPQPSEAELQAQEDEAKIQAKMREQAVEALITAGELTGGLADYIKPKENIP